MQIMYNSKNIRIAVAIWVVFSLFMICGTVLRKDSNASIQRVKPALAADSVPLSEQQHDDLKNTLQGSVHGTPNTPYAQEDVKKPVAVPGEKGKPDAVSVEKTKPNIADKSANIDPNKPDEGLKVQEINDPACKKEEYVVMIDAGSTGSRVHVYKFNVCQSPPTLLNEEFEMLKPGLSLFDTDTVGAAKSLDKLLEVALKAVPEDKQSCTPVAVKATAGLRLLGEEKSKNLLDAVRTHLENDYPFAVVPGDGISIMDGANEGVYAWITTNFLLGNIGSAEKLPTAAVFDLGGGSTQIVFEPEFGNNEQMLEGEHKFEISFGGRKYTLYQFSHLGYGLMQGRNKVNSVILEAALPANPSLVKMTKEESKKAKATVTILNPCIARGVTAEDVAVQIKDDFYVVNMKGPSSPSGAQCRAISEKVLNKDASCSKKPCSFNGVHQPSLTKTFKKNNDMFVFSYFYDRTNPVGLPSSFTVEELMELAKVVCNGETSWREVLLDEHVTELTKEPQWCLDLSFITAMLHTGYDIPLYRELKTAKTIDNNELGWCLGASLPLLDKKASGWSCKVKQV